MGRVNVKEHSIYWHTDTAHLTVHSVKKTKLIPTLFDNKTVHFPLFTPGINIYLS